MIKLHLRLVTKTSRGTWRFRKQVPYALREALGRDEYVKTWKTEAQAMREYADYVAGIDREIEQATKRAGATAKSVSTPEEPKTPLENYRDAVTILREHGINPEQLLATPEPTDAEPFQPLTDAEAMLEVYEVRNAVDTEVVRMLTGAGRVEPPCPSWTDAAKVYVADKIEGKADETRRQQRIDRATGFIDQVIGRTKPIDQWTRMQARATIDAILATGVTPATAVRYLHDIRAVVQWGLREHGLAGKVQNHFQQLQVKGFQAEGAIDRDERSSLAEDQIAKIGETIKATAKEPSLSLIWRILAATGMRLAEASGLELQDVVTTGKWPVAYLRFNSTRTLKNRSSVRPVPLCGDALEAVKTALETTANGKNLFPAYARPRGADSCSAALMKQVRKVTTDPKQTVHSLRHAFEDRCLRQHVSEHDRALLMGHALTGEGNRYGSDQARLEALTPVMGRLVLPTWK